MIVRKIIDGFGRARKGSPRFKYFATLSGTSSLSSSNNNGSTFFNWVKLKEEKKSWSQETEIVRDMRSNHSGETGAVYIYKGAMHAMSLKQDRYSMQAHEFVKAHHHTEQLHLDLFNKLLDEKEKSRLLPLWEISGFLLGFCPTLLAGEKALYVTVEAVESFVEDHYMEQIRPLQDRLLYPELTKLLSHCCEEEIHHKNDARNRWLPQQEEKEEGHHHLSSSTTRRPWYVTLWSSIVGKGSQLAVAVCRRI